jgi:hypothetical protein
MTGVGQLVAGGAQTSKDWSSTEAGPIGVEEPSVMSTSRIRLPTGVGPVGAPRGTSTAVSQ